KSFIALADDYVTPVVYDAATGTELRRFVIAPEMARTDTTHDLRISDGGKTLITTSELVVASNKSYAVRWDVATGKMLERVEQPGGVMMRRREIGLAAYSPDRRWFVEYGKATRVNANQSFQLIPAMESGFSAPCFSPDGRLVALNRTPRVGENPD